MQPSRFHLLSFLLFIAFLSCNKPNDSGPSVPTQSSDKAITSFLFKVSNNLGLTVDVNSLISQDTIRFLLPYGTSLTNLVPTITFTGKSIQPSSGVAQDFNNPVTYTVTAKDGTSRKYVAVASMQGLQGVVLLNTVNGGASPYPSMKGHVYALDAITGTVHWEYGVQGYGFLSTPAFLNGILYTGNIDKIIALDTVTKLTKWVYNTGGTLQSGVTVVNGIVYSNCNDGYVYAVDAATGNLKWKFKQDIDDPSISWPPANPSSPTVANGIVYFGDSRSSYVYAVDAITGILKWKWFNSVSVGGKFESSPSVVNGIVYIGDLYGKLIALSAIDGSLKWSFNNSGGSSSPTVVNGIVYSGGSDNFYALDAATGVLKWNYHSVLPLRGSPTLVNGVAYITADGGNASLLYAIDVNTGTEKWRYFYGLSGAGSPVVFGGNVYFAVAYNFFSIDANTGKQKWMFKVNDEKEEIYGAPCVVDQKGSVYYSSVSGLQN